MKTYLLNLDTIPYAFYDELRNISETNAKWFVEKKVDFMVILEKYKIPSINYIPAERWTCSYCKNSNTKEHINCPSCGANIMNSNK